MRMKLKVLTATTFKFIMNIVTYINEKEFVMIDELYDVMIENKWNRNVSWCDNKYRLSGVLCHKLGKVVTNKKYYLVNNKSKKLYSLVDNWAIEVSAVFESMKNKGNMLGYYEVEE